MSSFTIKGNYVDIFNKRIFNSEIEVDGKFIKRVKEIGEPVSSAAFILPGFVDSHVHIESSMLVPSEFARMAVVHGTVGTVSDPHEIANVCGMQGVLYMIENGNKVPFKFNFGAPSCVPATSFETAGASLDVAEVTELLKRDDIRYLSEMMNFPGVLHKNEEVMQKIAAAKKYNKPVDGHAPGLRGETAKQYIDAGISTDHECFTADEAKDKLGAGMKILIREGSAARNFDALIDLLHDYPEQIMFCSDDKHPDSLEIGHIDQLCTRSIEKGIDIFNVLRAACVNPVLHYKLTIGLLRQNDPADFIVVKDLKTFKVLKTFVDGELVAEAGTTKINSIKAEVINNFNCDTKKAADFQIQATKAETIPVIEALDGQLITNKLMLPARIVDGKFVSDISRDMLKIAVVNRYQNAVVATAFIKNTGLKKGALASSVAHDSHNIVAIGIDDESLAKAVNLVIRHRGGVSIYNDDMELVVPLPVAGLMSNEDGYEVSKSYSAIDAAAKKAGATLKSPYMTLSFMALLVIPHLKLSDKGLFDGDVFTFIG